MRNKQHILLILFSTTVFACSTMNKSHQETANYSESKIEEFPLVLDTLTTEQENSDFEKDTLEFLSPTPIDVRWNVNDSINTTFSNNLDKMLHSWYVKNTPKTLEYKNEQSEYQIEKLPDSIYIQRLGKIPSMVDLSYNNIVRNYIELYTNKRREQVAIMLGLSEYYFPIFEEILDKEGLPQELKYLPIIESALNPKALSRVGASGLWQFMYSTGRMYKLEINSFIDERRDPVKASYAATKFLKDLYQIYGNWQLVIAAYNCGPGNVNKAIKRSGGKKNYWDIYYHLPKETRGYVPAFIAALYTFNYHEEHQLFAQPSNLPIVCDTLMIDKQLHFDQITQLIPISKEKLQELNPQYRADIIPATDKAYALKIPLQFSTQFIDKQDSIFGYKKDYYFNLKDKVVNPQDRYQKFAHVAPKNKAKIYYKVKSGDAVGLIASWFHVRTSDLCYWNNIRRNLIRVGQNLVIYVPRDNESYFKGFNSMTYNEKQATLGKTPSKNIPKETSQQEQIDNASYIYYTVRNGDNFWSIAKKYPGVSNYDIMKINNIDDPKSLKVGQKLKIRPKS